MSLSQPSNVVSFTDQRAVAWRERVATALVATALGVVLLYGVGFSTTVELHNAAHDSRHSAAFPCH